jgi:hypothetical protein
VALAQPAEEVGSKGELDMMGIIIVRCMMCAVRCLLDLLVGDSWDETREKIFSPNSMRVKLCGS